MADLKLARLPDRTSLKLSITVSPDLHRMLQDYAAAYERAYGVSESVTALIPAILETYLDSDRDFARWRRSALSAGTGQAGRK